MCSPPNKKRKKTVPTLSSSNLLVSLSSQPKRHVKKKKICQRGLSTRKANGMPGTRHPGNPQTTTLNLLSENKALEPSPPPLWGLPVSLYKTAKHMRETVITKYPSDTPSWLLHISSKIPVRATTYCKLLNILSSKNVKQCSCFNIFIVHNFKKYMSSIKYTCLVIFASSRKQILYFLFSFYNL